MAVSVVKKETPEQELINARSEELDCILEDYLNKIPKVGREEKKQELLLFSQHCLSETESYRLHFKRPTNSQRQQKLSHVAECAAALNDALKELTQDNYVRDLMRIKKYAADYNSARNTPMELSFTELFGCKSNSVSKLVNKIMRRFELVKKAQEPRVILTKFAYGNRGISKLLRGLEKGALKQARNIKEKKGGRAKSMAKHLFVELCAVYFELHSNYPINSTLNGKFRSYISLMNKLTFNDEGELEKEIKACVKRRKVRRDETQPSSAK